MGVLLLRVILEIDSILRQRHSGFFTYGAGLLEGLLGLEERPEMGLFCSRRAFENKHWLAQIEGQSQLRWHTCRMKPRHLGYWWQWFGIPSLQNYTGPFDIYHCNHHLMPPTKGKPRILTVHDLRRYRYPEFYPQSKLGPFENAVNKADHFIAISQSTKSDLQEYFDIAEEKIDVVYHGGPIRRIVEETDEETLLQKFDLQKQRYFIAFSSYDRRKNLPNLMRAFAQIVNKLPVRYQFVIIGSEPRHEDIFPGETKASLKGRIVFTGPLDNITPLLRQSTALVYVSLYEGFGLPLLEAMAAGTAVITSNCSSLPEVAGEAGLMVDPHEPEEIGRAMMDIAVNEQLRAGLIEKGEKRARDFSWQKAAKETMAVYKKLI